MSGTSTRLVNVNNTQDSTISNILLDNFVCFYDWGFLDRGSFYNINISQSDIYGGRKDVLRAADDPNLQYGRVWESYRKNWVWESGVSVDGTEPIEISGVFVNETFYATGNTTNPYYIDYPNGRVVFDSNQPSGATVQLEYSHKWLEVVPAEGIPFFRQIQQNSFRNEAGFQVVNSGGWAQLGETRLQLPALAIEVNPPRNLQPYALGGGQWVNNDIVFYAITENYWEAQNIIDIIMYQNDRDVPCFNPTAVAISGTFPFNYRNELNENAIPSGMYPNMAEDFLWRDVYVYDSQASDITQLSPDLYIGTARCSTQVKAI